jgi:23S rRNA (uracil1939-C5)-methyltransferase
MSDQPPLRPNTAPLSLERKPRPGLEITVDIEQLTLQGKGSATLDVVLGPQKLARRYQVEVRSALVGERVRAKVLSSRRGLLEAEAIAIETASAARIEPRCQHADRVQSTQRGCGGCALQSLSGAGQLSAKKQLIASELQKNGLDPGLLREPLAAQSPWHYRNKLELSFAQTRELPFALGMHPPGYRYEVLPLSECLLLSEPASRLIPEAARVCRELGLLPYRHKQDSGFLRTLTIREGKRSGERMLELTTSFDEEVQTTKGRRSAADAARTVCEQILAAADAIGCEVTSFYWTQHRAERGKPTRLIEHHLAGSPVLRETLIVPLVDGKKKALRFEIHPRAFFQPNTLQAELLYGTAIAAACQSAEATQRAESTQDAETGPGATLGRVLDLYCGTGTISLVMASICKQVIGIELSEQAVENARRNALFNEIENATFIAGDVGKVLANSALGKIDLVVVDPPRSGLMPQAMEHIGKVRAPRIVYVSCNPQSLARDLKMLQRRGYETQVIQPVDMFPHTGHIENVALLVHRNEHADAS